MNSTDREQTLEAVNQALRDLGRRFAAGELDRGEFRRLRRALVAEAAGDEAPPTDDEPPTGRHPAINADSRLWSRWLPLALAGGVLLAGLAWWLS